METITIKPDPGAGTGAGDVMNPSDLSLPLPRQAMFDSAIDGILLVNAATHAVVHANAANSPFICPRSRKRLSPRRPGATRCPLAANESCSSMMNYPSQTSSARF
jgi:hypothetical protein